MYVQMGMVKTPYDLYSLAPQLEAMLAAKKPKKKASKKSKKAASEEANETSTVTSEAGKELIVFATTLNISLKQSLALLCVCLDTVESPAASANATLGWGPKSVANLLAAIDKSRSLSSARYFTHYMHKAMTSELHAQIIFTFVFANRFLYALGQQFIGLNTAQSVVSHFGGFKAFWDFAQRIRGNSHSFILIYYPSNLITLYYMIDLHSKFPSRYRYCTYW